MDQYVTRASLQQLCDKWQHAFLRLNRGEPGISGLLSTAQAWEQCSAFLCPRPLETYTFPFERDFSTIAVSYGILEQVSLTAPLLDKLLDDFRKQKHLITEEVRRFLDAEHPDAEALLPITIAHLVHALTTWYEAWKPPPQLPLFCSSFRTAFQTHLYMTLPPSFNVGFQRLVRFTLDKSPSWTGDVQLPSSLLDFSVWKQFESLGMLERYENIVHSVVYGYMEDHVERECRGTWTEKLLAMNEWLSTELFPWLFHPFAQQARSHDEARSMVTAICKQLQSQMVEMLGKLRIQEFFDIINDWPDSRGAVQDLGTCLASSNLRSHFVKTLKAAQRERLLHPGTDTDTILGYYITAIRCLRLLDPLGSILHEIATPIRQYVRARSDTIRLIVDNLVREEDSLIDADEPVVPLQSAQAQDYTDENWTPEPKDAAPEFRSSKPLDIVSTLVSIYDSRDLFIKELQIMLAKRLQEAKEGGLDNERRHVEILKVRFGESALQVCEVMLRDMTDSRRIDQHIQARVPMELHPTVISSHFWPSMQTTQVTLPPRLQAMQDKYSHEFHLFKPDKRLHWLPLMGYVRIEVELEDRIIDKECSPLAAAVIELFLDTPKLTITELMTKLRLKDRQEVVKGVMAWVEEGVLDQVEGEEDMFEVLEYAKADEDMRARPVAQAGPPEDEPSAVEAAQQQQAEQMRVYWKFIEGMLRNLGGLPADRIQSMLKLAPGYDRTPEQLAMFMEAARREELVVFTDGKWRLRG